MIAELFTRKQFFALIWSLHLTDLATYTLDRNDPQYDKLHQTRGLIERIRRICKRL